MLRTLIGLICIMLWVGTWAQESAVQIPGVLQSPVVMTSMYLDWGFPARQFRSNMRENGIGFGGEALYNLQRGRPVWAGVGVHTFAFDDYSTTYTYYREKTTSRMFAAHGLIRFQPRIDYPVQPYIQGGAGVHWLFTNTKIRDTDAGEIADRINESRDAALGFALHAGAHYVPRKVPWVRADVRFGYFRNASVEYLRYNDRLSGPNGLPVESFERRVSVVDMFGLHIGFTLMFSGDQFQIEYAIWQPRPDE
jgi:hypothetical protein